MPRQFGVPEKVIASVLAGEQTPEAYSNYLAPIHGKHVIGVNAAFLMGTWMDVVFYGDGGFFFANRNALLKYPKLRVTCNPNIKNRKEAAVMKHVQRDGKKPQGLSTRSGYVSWNGNSGAAAINLASQMGSKRIILLGFDMNLDKNSKQHWHSQYKSAKRQNTDSKKLPFHRHIRCFPLIARDAKRQGIEIINVSPESAIRDFVKCKLKDVL